MCPYTPQRNNPCGHQPSGSNSSCAVLHFTPEVPCQCEVIAKARADERAKCIQVVEDLSYCTPDGRRMDDASSYKGRVWLALQDRNVVTTVGTKSS